MLVIPSDSHCRGCVFASTDMQKCSRQNAGLECQVTRTYAGPLTTQHGGSHYKDMAIQPIEYIHANKLPFAEGSVVKYISRHARKGGADDIRKAIHFCELILELEYKGK